MREGEQEMYVGEGDGWEVDVREGDGGGEGGRRRHCRCE